MGLLITAGTPHQREERAEITSEVVADEDQRAWAQVDVTPSRLRDSPSLGGGQKGLVGM